MDALAGARTVGADGCHGWRVCAQEAYGELTTEPSFPLRRGLRMVNLPLQIATQFVVTRVRWNRRHGLPRRIPHIQGNPIGLRVRVVGDSALPTQPKDDEVPHV